MDTLKRNMISVSYSQVVRVQKGIWKGPFIGIKRQRKTVMVKHNLPSRYYTKMERERRRIWKGPFTGIKRRQKMDTTMHVTILHYCTIKKGIRKGPFIG